LFSLALYVMFLGSLVAHVPLLDAVQLVHSASTVGAAPPSSLLSMEALFPSGMTLLTHIQPVVSLLFFCYRTPVRAFILFL